MRRLSFVFLLCLLFGYGVNAQGTNDTPLAAPTLYKGVNLSNWLANAERQPLAEKDFEQIKAVGFDNVRLPVKPEILENTIAGVDRAILMAAKNDLVTVIDLHPGSQYMDTLQEGGDAESRFISLWVNTAKHYKNYRTDRVVFGLLNEPHYYQAEDKYNDLVARTVKAIREVDADRWLVVSAPDGSSVQGLEKLKPLDDTRIIYDFHFYQPYIITHQGIKRGFEDRMLGYFRNLPYPSELVSKSAAFYAPNAPDPAAAEAELKAYTDEKWDRNHIEKALKLAKEWGERNKAMLLCSEFGVVRKAIPADSRYGWIADVRKSLEFLGMGWQIWDYTDLDGITKLTGKTSTDKIDGSVRLADPEIGQRLIEKEAVIALGLVQPLVTRSLTAPVMAQSPAPQKPNPASGKQENKKELITQSADAQPAAPRPLYPSYRRK